MIKLPIALDINPKERSRIKDYFEKCAESIDDTNRYMLRKCCKYISIGYAAMTILAYLIVPGFKITIYHLTIIPLITAYFFINLHLKSRTDITSFHTSFICLMFYFLFCVHFIFLDVITTPNESATWLPLMLICFPIVFIDHLYKYIIEESVIIVLFVTASFIIKDFRHFSKDLYVVFAAFMLSILMINILLRVRSYEALSIDAIKQASIIDPLTKIYNKRALLDAINDYYTTRKENDPCAICIIDVDNFKKVNDTLGHNKGDVLLAQIGSLLRRNFRSTDIIGRFGGDEFLVFMPGLADKSLIEMRCRSMQMFLTDFKLDPDTQFSLSIGAVVDCVNLPYDKLFAMADDALYQSKQAGKNCCTAWSVNHLATTDKDLLLLAAVKATENTSLLEAYEGDRFDIIRAYNGSDSIKCLSQYQGQLSVAVIHMDITNIDGKLVIKYIKSRTGFENIKVLAVCTDKKSLSEATAAGADIALLQSAEKEDFFKAIDTLSGHQ